LTGATVSKLTGVGAAFSVVDELRDKRFGGRLLPILAVVTLVIAALASGWRFFAAQSPSSPVHIGPLLGPIESLVAWAWLGGIAGLTLCAALPRMRLAFRAERRVVLLLAIGWIILLASFLAGAVLGTHGTQVIRAYPRTLTVMLIRLPGFLILLAGLVALLVALLRRAPGADRGD
jgi:hypothetical protein